jgi:hypothetical protein
MKDLIGPIGLLKIRFLLCGDDLTLTTTGWLTLNKFHCFLHYHNVKEVNYISKTLFNANILVYLLFS